MVHVLGVLNACWMAGFLIAKLGGDLTWPWWIVWAVAFAPLAVIALLCWVACATDHANKY